MYREVSKLILYRDLGEDSILFRLAGILKTLIKEFQIKTNQILQPEYM